MKQFNLEQAKQGKPVCTRDGRDVEILKWDLSERLPIVAVVDKEVYTYTNEGLFSVLLPDCDLDLFMKSEKKEGWVNVLIDNNKRIFVGIDIFKTEEEAMGINIPLYKRVSAVKITWEE